MRNVPEKYQLGPIGSFLKSQGIDYSLEARMYSIPIDLVGRRGNTTIAIELKSNHFKKGIKQALRNSRYVDYSFLSVWQSNVTEHLIEQVKNEPIGLIAVDEKVNFILPPEKNSANPHAKKKVIKRVNGNA